MNTRLLPKTFVHDLLQGAFPPKLDHVRKVGSEEEFIVVHSTDGIMGNTLSIFPDMIKDGWVAKHDAVTDEIVGVRKDEVEIGTDVGIGTLEIGFPPVGNLFDHIPIRNEILRRVDQYLARYDMFRLDDYAAQPVTVPLFEHWAPKGRSHFFRTFFPRAVDVQTASAASQVHVEVTQEELIPVLEIMLALSGVLIALNANSPIWGEKIDPENMLAARQHFWDRFTPQKGCWSNVHVGLPAFEPPYAEQPPSSVTQLAEWICGCKFLVHIDKGEIVKPNVTFGRFVEIQEGRLNEIELRELFMSHEGTLWWDARPRVPFGTIEVRPSCQNALALCSDAVVLGLVENWNKAHEYVHTTCTHEEWRRLRFLAIKNGLRARGAQEAARTVLTLANEGLKMRGLGEEQILKPLYTRLKDGVSPAHQKLNIFNDGGMKALLKDLIK